MRLLALLGILALAEITVFFWAEQRIGFLPILAVVLLTALVGLLVIRRTGVAVFGVLRTRLSEGRLPGEDLSRGVASLIGGICLLLPGLITDLLGLALLTAPIQGWVHRQLSSRVSARVSMVTSRVRPRRGRVIDVDPVERPRFPGPDPEMGPGD